MAPIVRVLDAGLGSTAQVRLVVAGVSDPARLRSAWASSGAAVDRVGDRLEAVSTVAALERAAGRCLPSEEAALLEEAAAKAVIAWVSPSPPLQLPDGPMDLSEPLAMGICNVTPDSFSDGGLLYPDDHPDAAVRWGLDLAERGAAIVDVGGESTRPGSQPVASDEEGRRVLPVVERLAADGVTVSIDTTKPEVAREAVRAGAGMVNDVSGGRPELLEAVATTKAAYVLMHARGTPADMQRRTDYTDVVAEVYEYLAEGLERCAAAGIDHERVVIDPGIGFAKTAEQSMALLRAVPQLRGLGRPVLIGASRKSFLGAQLAAGGDDADQRLEAGLAVAAVAVADGAAILRVHDVRETVRAVRIARGLRRSPPA